MVKQMSSVQTGKLSFIKNHNNSKQNNQVNQASLPSTSTKVASSIVSWDLQSRSLNTSALWVANRQSDQNYTHEHKASQNEANTMATHHRYKKGHTPQIQKVPKRPTLACGTKCNLLQQADVVVQTSVLAGKYTCICFEKLILLEDWIG